MNALAWLHPGWLWGLAAMSVPIAVHLLSRGPARRVLLGSIRLLESGSSRRARRLRFTDPWLALMRVLLVAAAALALAGPQWLADARAPTWGLVAPGLLVDRDWRQRAPAAAARLDRLADEGALRVLAPGLPRPAAAGPAADSEPRPVAGGVWSLLREADAVAPSGTTFEVFTHGSVAELSGPRPSVAREVVWHVAPVAEATWTQRSVRFPEGERVWTALASPSLATVAWPEAPERGSRPADDASVALPVVLYAHPDRADDAGYLVAAVEAVAASGWLPVALTRLEPVAADRAPHGEVAIWLSPEPLPTAWTTWARGGGLVLRDTVGTRYRSCATVADLPDGLGSVAVRRCSPVGGGDTVPVWQDRQGRPFLVSAERGHVLQLTGRFHPAWSDLVVSASLPRWLAAVLDRVAVVRDRATSDEAAILARDRRQAGSEDRQPRAHGVDSAFVAGASLRGGGKPIGAWLWALVATFFAVERRLAARREP